MKSSRIPTIFMLALTVVGGWQLYLNRYNINDWWRLRNYTPSAEIEQLAELSSMNSYGERLFYVHDPGVEAKLTFNEHCSQPETGLVLGCYNGVNIFILDVTDPALENVELVTAAHEMLHAGYDRLSSKERDNVDKLLTKEYQLITNERVLDIIDQYEKDDPNVLNNELHSIIGTELDELDPELEQYYSQYFEDRSIVVQAAKEYEKVFIDTEAKVDDLEKQISILAAEIETRENSLSSLRSQLNQERSILDELLNKGDIDGYNEKVAPYNSLVNNFNAEVGLLQDLLDQHNQLISVHRETALQYNNLINNLNSTYQPIN